MQGTFVGIDRGVGLRVIVVGIDEAGYGPILGPLVVSAVGFDIPDDRADRSLWELLSDSVTQNARKRDHRLAIADSKKLYDKAKGLELLERAALSVLQSAGSRPASFSELLTGLCPRVVGEAGGYPWYAHLDIPLPVACQAAGLGPMANALSHSLTSIGGRFLGAISEPLLEGQYNDLVSRTKNKSVVLLGLTLRLIQRMADGHAGANLRIGIDRQGGRTSYGRWLMTSFEDFALKIVEESNDRSAYRMSRGSMEWQVEFAKKGEDRHLPVALASIFSKYTRELFMRAFNGYWQEQVPGVKPTAGYYTDGTRFLDDIRPHLGGLGIEESSLVRQL